MKEQIIQVIARETADVYEVLGLSNMGNLYRLVGGGWSVYCTPL